MLGLAFTLCLFCVTALTPAYADSWLLPETENYLSANGKFRLTVTPRDLDSQLGYFETKVNGEALPEPLGPKGKLETLDKDGQWILVWSRNLVNEVSPVSALVSEDGTRVVTFDNWHSVGHGDDVVVIYNRSGEMVRSLSLNQIVPNFFIDGFSRSVSSISWKDRDPQIAGQKLLLGFSAPAENDSQKRKFTVSINLEDGTVEPIAENVIAAVKPNFCVAHKSEVASFNAQLAYERYDLVAPSPKEKDDWAWRRYVANAMERLKPDEKMKGDDLWLGETDFELLLPNEYMEKDFRDSFRDALLVPAAELQRRWFFSKDQERMTLQIEKTARKIKVGQLTGVDMRFFADSDHWLRIRAVLLQSGAQLTQINTAVPIPQKPEMLATLPTDKQVDSACFD